MKSPGSNGKQSVFYKKKKKKKSWNGVGKAVCNLVGLSLIMVIC